MMLSIGYMAMGCGKWQGKHTNLCGLKEVGTATWSYTLITSAIFADLSKKWRSSPQKPALKRFGRACGYIQGTQFLLTGAVESNDGDQSAYVLTVLADPAAQNVAGDRNA